MKKHYAHRMPSISHSYGLFFKRNLVGVCTFGLPASPFLCKGVCGNDYKDIVIEFNRLCLNNNKKNEGSYFLSYAIKLLSKPKIIVSYADTKQGHIGFIYQATNWLYTGATKERTDMLSLSGHSRHNEGVGELRQHRSSKHRYIYFIGSKKQKKEMLKALNYPILPYPKGESKRYDASAEFPTQIRMF